VTFAVRSLLWKIGRKAEGLQELHPPCLKRDEQESLALEAALGYLFLATKVGKTRDARRPSVWRMAARISERLRFLTWHLGGPLHVDEEYSKAQAKYEEKPTRLAPTDSNKSVASAFPTPPLSWQGWTWPGRVGCRAPNGTI